MRARLGGLLGLAAHHVRRSCKPACRRHKAVGAVMQDRDLIPLAAWIMWEVFFDEPEPTDAHGQDDQKRKPPEVKTPRRGIGNSCGSGVWGPARGDLR